jgi:hypothetical protein
MKSNDMDTPTIGWTAMPQMQLLRKALLALGILAALTWISADLYASFHYEGYQWPIDAISGLSTVDSPVQSMSRAGTLLYDLMRIGFAAGVWLSADKRRSIQVTAAALLAFSLTDFAASLFPWYPEEPLTTPANLAHGVFAGALPMIWFFLSIAAGASAGDKGFWAFSYATILAILILGALPLLGSFEIGVDQPPAFFGASERINAYGYMLWMIALAIVLLRNQAIIRSPEETIEVVDASSAANRN